MDTVSLYDLRCRKPKKSKVSKLGPTTQIQPKLKMSQPEDKEEKSGNEEINKSKSINSKRSRGEVYSLEEDSCLWKSLGSWRDQRGNSQQTRMDLINNMTGQLHRTPAALQMRMSILRSVKKDAFSAVDQNVDLSAGSPDSILWSKCHGAEGDSYKVLSSSAVKGLEKILSVEVDKSQLPSTLARVCLIRNLKWFHAFSGLQLEAATEAAPPAPAPPAAATFSEAPSAFSSQLKPQKRAKRAKLASSLSQEMLPPPLSPPLPPLTLPSPLPLHCLLEGGVAVPPDEPVPAVLPMPVPSLPPPVLQPVPMPNRLLSPATASSSVPERPAAAVESPTLKVNNNPPPSPPLPFECAFMFSKAEIESIWRIYTRNVKNNVVQEPDLTLDLCSLAEDLACTYPQIKARLQLLLDLDQRHVVLPKK